MGIGHTLDGVYLIAHTLLLHRPAVVFACPYISLVVLQRALPVGAATFQQGDSQVRKTEEFVSNHNWGVLFSQAAARAVYLFPVRGALSGSHW